MSSASLANHFGGAVNANHIGARGCDLSSEMTRAAADVQDALARLGVEQFQKSGSHLPDKGVLFVRKAQHSTLRLVPSSVASHFEHGAGGRLERIAALLSEMHLGAGQTGIGYLKRPRAVCFQVPEVVNLGRPSLDDSFKPRAIWRRARQGPSQFVSILHDG